MGLGLRIADMLSGYSAFVVGTEQAAEQEENTDHFGKDDALECDEYRKCHIPELLERLGCIR